MSFSDFFERRFELKSKKIGPDYKENCQHSPRKLRKAYEIAIQYICDATLIIRLLR